MNQTQSTEHSLTRMTCGIIEYLEGIDALIAQTKQCQNDCGRNCAMLEKVLESQRASFLNIMKRHGVEIEKVEIHGGVH